MLFDRPDLEAGETFAASLEVAAASGDGQKLLQLTDEIYRNRKVSDDDGVRMANIAASVKGDAAGYALALYLEAFGEAGAEFASVKGMLKARHDVARVIEFLAARPIDLRNEPVVSKLHRSWVAQREVIGVSGESSKFTGHPDLIFVLEGANASSISGLLNEAPEGEINVLFQSKKLERKILSSLNERERERLCDAHIPKIDFLADPGIFTQSDRLASEFVECLIRETEGSEENALALEFAPAFLILARDLFSPSLRVELSAAQSLEPCANPRIVCIGHTGPSAAIEAQFECEVINVERRGRDAYCVEGDADTRLERIIGFLTSRPDLVDLRNFDFPDNVDGQQCFVVQGKATDRQALGNLEHILLALPDSMNIIFEPGRVTRSTVDIEAPQISQSAVASAIDVGRIGVVWTKRDALKNHWHLFPMKLAAERAMLAMVRARVGVDGGAASGLLSIISAYVPMKRRLREFMATIASWEPVVGRASGVLVCPGRHVTGLAVIALGRRHGVPSYELQSGTVSASGRFVASTADTFFVNDEYSYDVFQNYLNMPPARLKLVGSPRLDAALRVARNTSVGAARRICYGEGVGREEKVFLFATQPLEKGIACQIFENVILAFGALPDSIKISVRVHPNEGEELLQAYSDILRRLNFPADRVIPSSYNGMELKAAAGIVTFYSTIGLEGLALSGSATTLQWWGYAAPTPVPMGQLTPVPPSPQ